MQQNCLGSDLNRGQIALFIMVCALLSSFLMLSVCVIAGGGDEGGSVGC